MALGAKAASPAAVNLPLFVGGLDHANEVVRYLSAMGLTILGASGARAAGKLQQRLVVEPSPQVRVAIAEALGAVGRKDAAVQPLIGLLEDSASDRVKLQAINALTFLGVSDPATLAALRRAQQNNDEYVSRAAKYQVLVLIGAYRPDAKIFEWGPGLQQQWQQQLDQVSRP